MRLFLLDYPKANQKLLSTNYRSTHPIVAVANTVIRENKNRFPKDVTAFAKEGNPVVLHSFTREKLEYDHMGLFIKELLAGGKVPSDIAVLARTNLELSKIRKELEKRGIQNEKKESEDCIQNPNIQGILSYMQFVAGDHSRKVFLRFMNTPLRYIKRDALRDTIVSKKDLMNYYAGNIRMQNTINQLFTQLERMRSMRPTLMLHFIRKVMFYDKAMKEQLNESQYEAYLKDVAQLGERLKNEDSVEAFLESITGQQKDSRKADLEKHSDNSGIQFYTYHGSKGLEFDTVIIPNIIEGKVPPKQARMKEEVEEERRMFYVALTRAKRNLYLYTIENEKEASSRFLKPLLTSIKDSSILQILKD